jgi:hypothetical protein
MSYGYGLGSGQGGAKAKPVHKLMRAGSGARFCPPKGDSRNIIAGSTRWR